MMMAQVGQALSGGDTTGIHEMVITIVAGLLIFSVGYILRELGSQTKNLTAKLTAMEEDFKAKMESLNAKREAGVERLHARLDEFTEKVHGYHTELMQKYVAKDDLPNATAVLVTRESCMERHKNCSLIHGQFEARRKP